MLGGLWGGQALAQSPATSPAQQASPEIESIKRDLQRVGNDFRKAVAGPDSLLDPARRAAVAPAALPPLRRMIELVAKLETLEPENAAQLRQTRMQYQVLAAAYGDADAHAALEAAAQSPDAVVGPIARAAVLLADWLRAAQDPQAQSKILDKAAVLAKEHSRNDTITQIIGAMGEMGPADPLVRQRALSIAAGMDNPNAAAMKAQVDAFAKLRVLEGKPLTISGTTIDGRPFSTDKWNGKVVLVDFWATWSGPCMMNRPRIKKVYQDYHSKGLEVVGISNDYRPEDLQRFLAQDGQMPWPQVFDDKAARAGHWNSITTGFGIGSIPAMFLIDKQGNCRTVEAGEHFEQMIPRLLTE